MRFKTVSLLLLLSSICYADLTVVPANQAWKMTKETLDAQSKQCVKEFEGDIETKVITAIQAGEATAQIYVTECVTDKTVQKMIAKLRKLGYKVITGSENPELIGRFLVEWAPAKDDDEQTN